MDSNEMRYLPINKEVNMTWIKVIARVSDRGIIKIISQLNIKALPPMIDHTPSFNEQITVNTMNNKAVATSDASLKSNKLEGY